MSTSRNPTCRQALAISVAACLALLAGDAAVAAVAVYGWNCSYNGNTVAEGGSPSVVESNANALSVTNCGGDAIESHGTVYGSQWTGDHYFDYSFAQGARTAVSASSGLGVLHAFSTTAATSTPKAYEYIDSNGDAVAIDNQYLAYGASRASASWYDQLIVNQAPQYGRVVLKFTLTLSGSTGVTPASAGSASIFARFIADDDRSSIDPTLSLSEGGTVSFTAGYWPGTVIKLYGDLSAATQVRAGGKYQLPNGWWATGNYIPDAQATANASNTAGFQVEVLTEGASYTSASGHSYVGAVPEPASAALMGLGMLGVLFASRRPLASRRSTTSSVCPSGQPHGRTGTGYCPGPACTSPATGASERHLPLSRAP